MKTRIRVPEAERQMVLLALAWLSLDRPGWDFAIGQIADKLHGRVMFEEFKRLNADRVKHPRFCGSAFEPSSKILEEMMQHIRS